MHVVQEPVVLGVDRCGVGLVVHRVEHRFDGGPERFGGDGMRLAAMASTRPRWASLVTRRMPVRPRATRSAMNSFQAGPVSLVDTRTPSTSRCPSLLTPVAARTAHETTHPPSRTFMVSASVATKVKGPASSRGRLRNCSTCSSRSDAMRETSDFDSPVIPRVLTSLSMRRVDTPAR